MKRVQIGVVGVDSGQILLCDPCYIDSQWVKNEFSAPHGQDGYPETKEFSYDGCCRATLSKKLGGQLNYKLGHSGVGVAVASGYGDGLYPVFVTYNTDGRIQSVEIVFAEEE